MSATCCGDDYAYAAAPAETSVAHSESIALSLLCIVFILLFYGSILLLCLIMYPKLPKDAIGDEESGEPLSPSVTLTKKTIKGEGIEAEVCVICLEDLKVNDAVRIVARCKHVFHVECIDSWCCYKLSCPICRAPFQWFREW